MQGLADLLVLRRHKPRRVAITWAYHPRALPMAVPNTALLGFARAGYDVVFTARSSEASRGRLPGTIEATAEEVRAAGRRAMPVALDVRDEAGVSALAERVLGEWGRCDLVVNNAALAPPKPALEDTTQRWRLARQRQQALLLCLLLRPRMPGGAHRNISGCVAGAGSAAQATTTRPPSRR
jgi:NAD(P)-dependent dehydrogenase (short-subunit alcohol dehydrogenase family)